MTAQRGPVLRIDGKLDRAALEMLLPRIVRDALPAFLPTCRWFGHKERRIADVQLADHAIVALDAGFIVQCVIRLTFDDGGLVRYFVPLSVTASTDSVPATIATIEAADAPWRITDAPAVPWYRAWLYDQLGQDGRLGAHRGVFDWDRAADLPPDQTRSSALSRLVSAEQSNTSVIYGSALILKLFRRLEAGLNPDVEISRFLSTRTGFRNIPPFVGDLRYTDADGSVSSIAVAQGFVDNVGDGWTYTLERLIPAGSDAEIDRVDLSGDAAMIGQTTAQLHLALASNSVDPAMAPEAVSAEDVDAWTNATALSISRVEQHLRASTSTAPAPLSDLIAGFTRHVGGLRARLDDYRLIVGRSKTRVHGDFHLGQILRTPAGDYVVLDFEGEPRRSIAERTQKISPLKDVAGMLRSFGYARGVAERALHDRTAARDLVAWERSTRRAFLDAYFDEVSRREGTFLPAARADLVRALAPWEIDKALYEVEYELGNRPDWLWLPLSATLAMV